jgi:hypothetical protein
MNCKKHVREVPMVDAIIDFLGRRVVIGQYCLLCYNFVNKTNPEVHMLRDLLIKNMNGTAK